MSELTVGRFTSCNPQIGFNDVNHNGTVDEGDSAVHRPTQEKLEWSDRRYAKARGLASKGLKSFDHVFSDPVALVGGIAADVVLSEVLIVVSVGYGALGKEGNFASRFANTWTYFPRAFSEY